MNPVPVVSFVVAAAISVSAHAVDSSSDRAALTALYEAYRQAWLRNDADQQTAVMDIFADAPVIVPSGGRKAHFGRDAMQEFWFPEDAPVGTVELFEQEPLVVSAGTDHGYVLGRFKLIFAYPGERYETEGYNLFSAVKQDDEWRVAAMMWTHPEWVVEKSGD